MNPFRPTDPEFLANPYPTYARLRREAPILYYEPWDKWIVTRHGDINSLLRDRRLGRVMDPVLTPAERAKREANREPRHAPFAAIQAGSLLEIEPPDHTRLRGSVHAVFTPKHVRELAVKIEALCEQLVTRLQGLDRPFNLLTNYAEPIPVTVIADLLGVPESERSKLVPWSKAIIGMFEPERTPADEQEAVNAAAAFSGYVRELIKLKRRHPQDDLISRLTELHDNDPEAISESEIVANAILFLNAGHEAVVNVIGNGVYALLRHPEQLRRLRDDPSLMPTAVEEMMRFNTPLQFFERFILEDMTYQGHTWPRGSKLCLYYASANHDEAVFEQPEVFDVSRQHNPHIAFGLGLHYCIGAPLARLELSTALSKLLAAFPNLQLVAEPEYQPRNVFRYLKGLEVSV